MEIKEIKEAIDEASKSLKEGVEGAKGQAAEALKKAGEFMASLEGKADKSAVDGLVEELKAAKEQLQKQHDALSAKVNSKSFNQPQAPKSFDAALKEAITEATDDLRKFERKETKSFSIELKAVADVSTGNVTGGSRYGQLMQPGIIESPARKVHVRQLLPGGPVGAGNSYHFMRENGDGEGTIAPVSEGATINQIDVDLVESSVNIEQIAGFLRVTRKAMNNIPGFISFLQSRLPQKLWNAEDSQVLYGTGASPELKGILASGNYTASTSAATTLVERLIDDIAVLEDTHQRSATGILLRPVDYFGFFKNKASGSGEYDLPQNVVFVNGVLYISGVPVFASTALGQSDVDATAGVSMKNDYIVGDFQNGAQLLTQEGMRIEFFEQDGTNVRENKVTVRIEETVALPVYGSNYFIKGNVA